MKKVTLLFMMIFCIFSPCKSGIKDWFRKQFSRGYIHISDTDIIQLLLGNAKTQSISHPYNDTVNIPIYETDHNEVERVEYIRMDIKLYWLLVSNGLFQARDIN